MFNFFGMDDIVFCDQCFIELGVVYFGRCQQLGLGVDQFLVVEQIEVGDVVCQCNIGFKEGVDGFDIGLVFIKSVVCYFVVFGNGIRNDFFVKISCIWVVIEKFSQEFVFEDVNVYGSQVVFFLRSIFLWYC